MTESSVSAIIPTRNNETSIAVLLKSIQSQSTKVLETIVVDGSSTDNTRSIARDLGARIIEYECTGDERALARNLGARAANGSILLFLDSDMELTTGVVGESDELIERGHAGVIFPEVTMGTGLIGAVRAWERNAISSTLYLTVARAISKAWFLRAGGFDQSNRGFEDLAFQATLLELGAPLVQGTTRILHHEEEQYLGSYVRKRRYYHRSAKLYKLRHPDIARVTFSPIDRARIYTHGVKDLHDTLLMSLALFLRAVELL